MSSPILYSFLFDGAGGGNQLSAQTVSDELKNENLAWVHLDAGHLDARAWLEREISYLDQYILDALLAEETRPRMTRIGEGALLILRGVNLNENERPEDMISIRMWVDRSRIITLGRRKLRAVADLQQRLSNSQGPRDAGSFVGMIVARLFERMQPVLSDLDDASDEIEEEVLDQANIALRERIVGIRKQAILFRRYMAPQRDAVWQVRAEDFDWLSDSDRRSLLESHNHISRYVEDLDALRERTQIIKDEISNIMSDRLNKNTYVLSVVASIFLPLGFLTGLLGINVGGIPGADNTAAFAIFCAILLAIVAFQVWLFKKMKWF